MKNTAKPTRTPKQPLLISAAEYQKLTQQPKVKKSRDIEADMRVQLLASALIPPWEEQWNPEIPGHPRYRLDFAWPDLLVCLECQGGTWVAGLGHSSGAAIRDNAIRTNLLQLHGWTVIQVTTDMIRSGMALQHIEAALERCGGVKAAIDRGVAKILGQERHGCQPHPSSTAP